MQVKGRGKMEDDDSWVVSWLFAFSEAVMQDDDWGLYT
jgi:hypothetical protein